MNARTFNLLEKETETESVVVGGFCFKAVLVIIKLEAVIGISNVNVACNIEPGANLKSETAVFPTKVVSVTTTRIDVGSHPEEIG